ncbi:glycosyltransferase family 4 protein [Shimazuella alba]|uniref:Glycosyltransferase n=1 Tax=Shimazuella alba TaxID=2690964 RepID=A0A6I4VWY6_9BACL|nr:glycosyltransferase family 4 protein [Shimazuella alba]MXQ55151.1 glycosyltransferase [Shimazuella alba]
MNVAMIGWEYPPQFSGGLGIHCQAITHGLTNLGISINFYLPCFHINTFEIPDGMKLYQVMLEHSVNNNSYLGSTMWDMVIKFQQQLESIFQPDGIDLIHAHDWMGILAVTPIVQKYKIPLIWTVHSTEYDRAAGMPIHPAIYAVEREALEMVKHTIVVSNKTKQILLDKYDADSKHITTIYNGIDFEKYKKIADRDYEKTDGYILFLGRITGQKAPDIFLEAAKLVIAEQKNVHFMMVGEGDLLHKLKMLAQRWKIDKNVTFTGGIFGEQLLSCYQNALLYVLPSRSEPFGITVLEAMAAGIPSIISSTTGVGEIVNNVYIVEPEQPTKLAHAMLTLLNDSAQRKYLGQQGYQEAQKWSWTRVAKRTSLLYQTTKNDLSK